ncbi:hypothetical protein CDD82_1148 [Ophiocordyceps australis]|uniref:Large ribosomal subunit protein bL27m n=1 Tax=Ophiocordyceps australis TaxID=1399860 RepID=A0A2C5YJ93_9HYPO|nr:hypothetical protein CDD82_1148 [Ophiocordyceps australis]
MQLLTIRPAPGAVFAPVLRAWSAPRLPGAVLQVRYASVKTQGAYKKQPKRGIPKKLGAKRTGGKYQYVIPGNIIYKQRGSVWHPGENCMMGRTHTIHAMVPGYVKYYRDPDKHPRRKYIGVTLRREDSLPYPKNAQRRRRLGMAEHRIKPPRHPYMKHYTASLSRNDELFDVGVRPLTKEQLLAKQPLSPSGIPWQIVRKVDGEPDRVLRLRDDYSYKEDNWRLGKLVKTAHVQTKQFRSRKKFFRHRRWRRDRECKFEHARAAALAAREPLEKYVVVKKKKATRKEKKMAKRSAKKENKMRKKAGL